MNEMSVSLVDLPMPGRRNIHWVIRRKAAVVDAVRRGILTEDAAMRDYNLTREEFQGWKRTVEKHGLKGLRATYLRKYNPRPSHQSATMDDFAA